MKYFYQFVLVVFIYFLFPQYAKASHVSGGDITYTCVGPNQYFITLKLFRDCSGTTMTTTAAVTFANSCGLANPTLTLYLQNPATGTNCTSATAAACATEISQLCPTQLPNSTCSGGTLPGMQEYVYTGTVTLPGACNTWTISYNLCCRNTSTNISGAPSFHVETTMYTGNAACNNSPEFTAQPVPYVCVNQLVSYNNGVIESDGDSLSYAIVSALQGTASPVTYVAPYTGPSPIPGITINSSTGQVTFTPTTTGIFVVVIMVYEYRNGVLIGTVMRDIQFVVQNCTNTVPSSTAGAITGMTGTAVQTGPYSIEMCEGNNFSFTATFTDTDLSNVLALLTNVTTVLPGATFTTSGTNPITATITWTAPGGSSGTNTSFFITVNDGACPIPGAQTMIYSINVLEGTYAGPDDYYCPTGGPVPLNATGGSTFTWTPATGLSCTNCPNPLASPTVTTSYIVTSNLSSASCKNKDTVTVFVVPSFTMSANPANATICKYGSVQLSISSQALYAPYTYLWTPATGLSSTTIANPVASPTTTTTYTVFATSNTGCTQQQTITVTVSGVAPSALVAAVSPTVCIGAGTQLNTTIYADVCSTTTLACTGTSNTGTIGAGLYTTTTYSPFFVTASAYSNRKQFLFRKTELDAMGFVGGGKISSIALNFTTAGTAVTGMVIKMGCTTLNEFPDGNHVPTQVVKTAFTSTPAIGWNTYALTNPYLWDGQSNLVVEFCVDNAQTGTTPSVQYDLPGFYAMIYDNILTTSGACSDPTGTRTTARARMQFTFCAAIPPTLTYSWTPTTGLNNSTISNPIATPTATTVYTVNIADGVCVGTATVQVNVAPTFTMTMSPNVTICNNMSTQLGMTPNPAGTYTYSWSPTTDLSSSTIVNPMASPSVTTTYSLSATSTAGCTNTGTVTVTVSGSAPAAFVAAVSPTVCIGSGTQLNTTISPDVCTTTTATCSGTVQTGTIGTAINSTTTYSPYYVTASAYSNRKQYLFRKTELDAMGFVGGGKISSIALNFTTAGTAVAGMVIKMGCTTLNDFPDGYHVAGLTTVKTAFTSTPTIGWNTFALTSPYMWDGQSNLIVEFCVDVAQTGTTASVQYSLPGFYAMIYDNIVTTSGACSDPLGTRTTARPNMQFTFCSVTPAGLNYSWTPATGLSSTSIQNPVASPTVNTIYTVTVTNAGCVGTGTVLVNVAPNFTLTMSPNATICNNNSTQISGTVSPAGVYSYNWTPTTDLSSATISNPIASPSVTTTYSLNATSSAGCIKTGSVTVTVSGSAPYVLASAVSPTVCLGSGVQVNTTIFPDNCTTTTQACTGTTNTGTIGAGLYSTTTYSPFYVTASAYSNRKQFLFRKTELDAMGFVGGGKISSIALNFTTAGTAVTGMVIKMGCTTLNEFPDGYHVATQVVKTAFTSTPVIGWNTYALTNPYMWDGQSNLVVEFCVDIAQIGTTASVQYDLPGFYAMIYDNVLTTNGTCSDPLGTRTTARARMQFTYCQATPSGLTYSWSPATGLSSPSVSNPIATPPSTTIYTVSVASGLCVGTSTVLVNVAPNFTMTMSPNSTICLNNSTQLNMTPSPAGTYTYSWSPATDLTSTTIVNPFASPTSTTTYTLTATSTAGCTNTGTVSVTISGISPIVAPTAADTTVCPNVANQMNTLVYSGVCTTTTLTCSGATNTGTVGAGMYSTTTYSPHFLSSTAYSNRKQYLFRKAELDAMGFVGGGKISSIALNYTTAGTIITGMVIKMGCTTVNDFPNGNHIIGLTTVKTSFNHTPTIGWNTFTLTNPYLWDGQSNLVVEFCVDVAQTGTTPSVQYDTYSWYPMIYDNVVTVSGTCSDPLGTRTTARPRMQFTFCQAVPSTFSYSWSPSTGISNPAIINPTSTISAPVTYTVTVTDGGSCSGSGSIAVVIDNTNAVTATPSDTTLCSGQTLQLNSTVSGSPATPPLASCGTNGSSCISPSLVQQVGTGTFSTTSYSPFFGSYSDAKQQILFTAASLTAAGMSSGTITSLAWNVITKSSTLPYTDFTISMGCTNATNLATTGWLPVTQVYTNTSYSSALGWNTFVLNSPFDWDGVSNIVVQACYNNGNAVVSVSDAIQYTSPAGYTAFMYNYSSANGTNGCSLAPAYTTTIRPNIRFGICPPPPNTFTYSWSPPATLSNSTIPNPTATPTTSVSYVVTVTGGKCVVTDTVDVTMCIVLPTELLSFSGKDQGETHLLEWSTATEVNNDYFTLERSGDGMTYESIAMVDAVGTSVSSQYYSHVDESPLNGINYYRLKLTDQNGASTYSNIVALENIRESSVLQIYPNPTNGNIFMDIRTQEAGNVNILVYDLCGRLVVKQGAVAKKGINNFMLNLTDVAQGTYVLKVELDGLEIHTQHSRITKQQ